MTGRYVRMCDHPEIQESHPDLATGDSVVFKKGVFKDDGPMVWCYALYGQSYENRSDYIWLPRIEDWMRLCGYSDIAWVNFTHVCQNACWASEITHESVSMPEAAALLYMHGKGYTWDDEKGWIK